MLNLKKSDHEAMDAYLDAVLNAYKDGTFDLIEARCDLAHAMSLAASDNPEFVKYIRQPVLEKRKNV